MRILETLSSTGLSVNEDLILTQPGRWAILLDGSSGLTPSVLLPYVDPSIRSDAQWLVHAFAQAFAQVEQPQLPLPQVVEQALALVEGQYQAMPIPAHLRGPEYEPSASLAILRSTPTGAELFMLGDCTAIWTGGTYQDPAVSRLDQRALQLCQQLAASTGKSIAQATQLPEVRQMLREHRRNKNRLDRPDGYGVLAPRAGLAQFGTLISLSAQEVGHVLIMSDGLAAGYQVYGLEDGPQAYLEAAKTSGLSALESRLREVEHADPDFCRFPRLKPSDDASGVLVEL